MALLIFPIVHNGINVITNIVQINRDPIVAVVIIGSWQWAASLRLSSNAIPSLVEVVSSAILNNETWTNVSYNEKEKFYNIFHAVSTYYKVYNCSFEYLFS